MFRRVLPTLKFNRVSSVSISMVLLLASCFAVPSVMAEDESWKDRFEFHGFLTQAWATANFSDGGPTPDEIILGIPEDGTTSYRFLALQFRYQFSDRDLVVVQLSSRSLGDSPIGDVEDDIELDWAFYERRLTDDTALKVGRIQIPLGIFNETRDVGTVLPFYRPPYSFYREGSFTSETVDGVLLHHTFFSASDFPLDFDVYFGEFELIEQAALVPDDEPSIAKAEDSYGVQLWLNTPWLDGVRFGLGGQRRDVTEGQEGIFRPFGGTTQFEDWYVSLEIPASRFIFRAEYRENFGELVSPLFMFSADNTNILLYLQAGFYITEKLHLYAQIEDSDVEQSSNSFTRSTTLDFRDDFGIALNYRFSPNVVLKAEYHEVDEEAAGFVPVFDPARGVLLDPIGIPFENADYSIISLAVSF